jgi:NAD-dependent histone deacetylase SIR2
MESEGTLADNPSLRIQPVEVIDLLSDDESSIDDATTREEPTRKDASSQVNAFEELDESDEDDEDDEIWENESLYEDALEGMGDEQLLAGGKMPETESAGNR